MHLAHAGPARLAHATQSRTARGRDRAPEARATRGGSLGAGVRVGRSPRPRALRPAQGRSGGDSCQQYSRNCASGANLSLAALVRPELLHKSVHSIPSESTSNACFSLTWGPSLRKGFTVDTHPLEYVRRAVEAGSPVVRRARHVRCGRQPPTPGITLKSGAAATAAPVPSCDFGRRWARLSEPLSGVTHYDDIRTREGGTRPTAAPASRPMRIPPLRSAVQMGSDVSPDSSVIPDAVRRRCHRLTDQTYTHTLTRVLHVDSVSPPDPGFAGNIPVDPAGGHCYRSST